MAKTTAPARERENAAPDGARQTEARPEESLRYVAPRCDVWETEEGATILVDVPGVEQAGLELNIEEDVLILHARSSLRPLEGRTVWSEWAPANFHRTFALSSDVNRDRIEATLRHGVLVIQVPKAEAARPRRIEVKAK